MNNQPNDQPPGDRTRPLLFAGPRRHLLASGAGGAGEASSDRLEVVVGADPAGGPVAIDLAAGPVSLAGPAGSGRTTTARLLAAQALRAGATCSIIDHRHGHARWVNGGAALAAVDLWHTPSETREGLADLDRLCDHRHALADRYQTDQPGGDHLHVLVAEDLHHLARALGPGSPAARALEAVIYAGRAAGLAVIATIGPHRAATSRPTLVEQFPTRITHHPAGGRGQVEVTDPTGGTRPARVIHMTPSEANAWAASGHVDVTPNDPAAADPAVGRPHRCLDYLDHIGGWPPYECVGCGRRLSHLDIDEDGQP